MDQLTQLYRNKAIDLQKRIDLIEKQLNESIAGVAKGVGKFAADVALQTPGAIAAQSESEKAASYLGAGENDAVVAATLANIPVALAGTPAMLATIAGWGAGKGIEHGVEASGLGDIHRNVMTDVHMALNPELSKGVASKEEVTKKAEDISTAAKEERMVDLEKGFAGEKEAKEFAEKMKDPKFREEYEKKMKEAEQKALRKAEGGSAVVANVSEYAPEIAVKAGEAIQRGSEWVGEKIYGWLPDSAKQAIGG